MANVLTFDLNDSALRSGLAFSPASARRWPTTGFIARRSTSSQQLNDRELADLGLTRFGIRQVAYDFVYGA